MEYRELGWFCSYTPLELICAANLVPVRLIGHSDAIENAEYMHTTICQYVRSCLDMALMGNYDRIKGVIFVNSCDAMRRLHDAWRRYTHSPFTFILDLPKGWKEADCRYLTGQFRNLRNALGKYFQIEITDEDVKKAIDLLNTSRSLYHKLNAMRTANTPLVSGKQMSQLAAMFFSKHPESWNKIAQGWLQTQQADSLYKARVLLSGSPIHNPDLVGFIEDCGVRVISEDLCTGSRFFDVVVEDTGDVMYDLSRAYLHKTPCARMMMLDERVAQVIGMAKKFDVVGVILHCLKFCDTYIYDVPEFKKRLMQAGLKVLLIEGDCTLGSIGQLKTRVEAFAEILQT